MVLAPWIHLPSVREIIGSTLVPHLCHVDQLTFLTNKILKNFPSAVKGMICYVTNTPVIFAPVNNIFFYVFPSGQGNKSCNLIGSCAVCIFLSLTTVTVTLV